MDAEDSVEITALSTDEAILIGLTRLAATRDEVIIEILDEGSRGFLGLGSRMARVKLSRHDKQTGESASEKNIEIENAVSSQVPDIPQSEKTLSAELEATSTLSSPDLPETSPVVNDMVEIQPQTSEKATDEQIDASLLYQQVEETVHTTAERLLSGLSVKLTTEWRSEEDRPTLWIAINGADANAIVGPRAQTLNSVQYLFRTLVHRQVAGSYDLVVDADGYRMRRRRSLENIARKNADKAVQEGQTVRLRSMPANERRIIHMILREDNRVRTRSVGTGRDRAITIIPNSLSD